MGRIPCCERDNVKRGQWTPEEDNKLSSYIAQHGTRNWRLIPKNAGLQRCGKSCRLRWTNYLRPDLKHGEFSEAEEQTIIKLHAVLGNRWSMIAGQLPGRTDNDVKNHWNTKLKKKLAGMGIDPVTHKPFSHLITEIATTLAPPQVAHLAEAALGCFKDEMLHLLTKKHIDFAVVPTNGNIHQCNGALAPAGDQYCCKELEAVQKIKLGLSKAFTPADADDDPNPYKVWNAMMNNESSDGCSLTGLGDVYAAALNDDEGFRYDGHSPYANEVVVGGSASAWSQNTCAGGSAVGSRGGGAALDGQKRKERGEQEADEREKGAGKRSDAGTGAGGMFSSECMLWDLPEELMNIHHIV